MRVQYIVDPHNQILVRVQDLTGSMPLISTKRLTLTGPYKELVKQVAMANLKIVSTYRYRM
jgi:hypothetical protein